MNKKNLVILATVGVLLVGTIAVATQSEMLAGRFGSMSKLYSYKGMIVSTVASPVATVVASEVPSEVSSEVISEVPSEVPSEVVSEGGVSEVPSEVVSEVPSEVPSEVVSEVPSAVVTAVVSPVAVSKAVAEATKISKLKALTAKIMQDFAKQEMKRTPSLYVLSDEQKERLLELYEANGKAGK